MFNLEMNSCILLINTSANLSSDKTFLFLDGTSKGRLNSATAFDDDDFFETVDDVEDAGEDSIFT